MTHRKIIHIDMDQFFAAVEQRDCPELRGRPVAVGHDEQRGVVSTASYEARRYGVHSAMSIQVAKRLCPTLTIVEPHFAKYKEVSEQIRAIFHDYTDLVEPLSLDEAFLDVTNNSHNLALGVEVAKEIKQRIKEQTSLTASAGVSYCKFLAKIASDYRKPDGLCVIHPDRAQEFIDNLQIARFWGVGHKTEERMHQMGVFTGADLRKLSLEHLTTEFGKTGRLFYDFARGIDQRPVEPLWERKSVGCEHTFLQDLSKPSIVGIELYKTVLELQQRIAKSNFKGHTLTLKIKFADFTQITRSTTTDQLLTRKDTILPLARQLLKAVDYSERPIRLLGLSVSGQKKEDEQPKRKQWIELEIPFKEFEEEGGKEEKIPC